ncbi:hypothetical protein L873DRAFT_1739786 [Choiromyces venosus 120613-1]|uniref:BRCT domain-containing protein n=1 Tax=Choiromyces venosus 120613-1 TaxID=1336337 RepID=A0A3N4JN92_9PEZI|nr:hypothetical protein L873DRAFT_1739786 [Choiromyces venosus 120613-1]
MNTFRPPSRRVASPAPSSSAWTLSSNRSTLSSFLDDEYGYFGSPGENMDDDSGASMSSQPSSSSIEFHSDSGPSISPLYGSTKSSVGRVHGPSSTTAGVKENEQTGIPSDVLPRLQVLLKNQVLVFLEGVEYDDLTLVAMLHKHSYKLAARNEEILEEVRKEGRAVTSEKAHLRYFKGLYRIIRKSQFSGVGGKLWGLWKLETVIAEAYRRAGIDPAIYGYPGLSSSEDGDEDMDDSETDLDSDEDEDDDLDLFDVQDETDDSEDHFDSDDTDDSSDMDQGEDHPMINAGGIENGPAYGPQFERLSERGLTILLDLLREFALNRYLLAAYKSILEHELVQPDEISELFTPKKLANSAAAIRAVRVKEACVISYMQSLTFLYKLQLLVEYERKDPEEYWDKDFEHPDYEDEPLSLLWSKSMMTMMMTHFHREESDSERYWHRHGLYHGHYQEDWSYKLMYMTNYLRFAEATVRDWFADPDAQEWEEHKQMKVEVRNRWFSEFGGRLKMIPPTKLYGNRAAIGEWLEGFEKEPVLRNSITELEANVLAGECFKFVDMRPEWRDTATMLIKRYGGAIHIGRKSAGKSVTMVLRPGQEDWIRCDRSVDCGHIMDYIHRKIVHARFARADKKALKNLVFAFRGILPTITREDAREIVYTYGGFIEDLSSRIDYVVVGAWNPLDSQQVWDEEMKEIEKLGIRKIDENGFAELLLSSQSWLRNGKRKAANGSAVGEVFKPTPKKRRMGRLSSLSTPDCSF